MKNSYNFYSFAFNPSVLGADKLWDNSSTIVGLSKSTQT
jgi:hypothetical protein